jgi:hypothetical protein
MVKKDYTEYERNLKDLSKKPLSKDFQKLIFPPESDVKKSEDHDPSVLPTSKLSMRKKSVEVHIDRLKEELLQTVDREGGVDAFISAYGDPLLEGIDNWANYRGYELEYNELSVLENFLLEKGRTETGSKKGMTKTSAWENLPRGWTEKSLKSFWNSLGGKGEHKVTKCIEKMEDKVDNPGAFCASLERRIESSNLEGKKLAVGDKILTSTKKKAKVVKVGTELAFWMSDEGGEKDFGSDFVEDIELVEPVESTVPVEGGLTKEVPLEEKVDLGEEI